MTNLEKPKAVIWFIAARPCLKESLELLYKNFNSKYRYPVVIFTLGKQYSEEFIRKIHENIDSSIKFIEVPPREVPSHIKEEELFYNRKEIPYVKKSFPKSRLGFLHINQFVTSEIAEHPEMKKYDIGLKMDDDTFIIGNIDFDIFQFASDNNYKYAPFHVKKYDSINSLQCEIGFIELVKKYVKENNIIPKSSALDEEGNWDRVGPYDPTIYDFNVFRTQDWKKWWNIVNESGGIYKYRWGDQVIQTLYVRMYYSDSIWHNFDFYNKGKCKHGGYGPVYEGTKTQRVKYVIKKFISKLLKRTFLKIRKNDKS